jgi:CRISPR-associated protein Cmr1
MHAVTLHLKTITPLFLGGADHQKGLAELRAPSIKGVLRYWYRAIDPAYNKPKSPERRDSPTWEEYLFGSAGYGTGLFRLVVSSPKEGRQAWNPNRYDILSELHPNCPSGLTKEQQRSWTLNGVRYLSYSLKMGDNDRKAIPAGQTITVIMRFPKKPEDARARRAIAAAWWLFGHAGGLGSRSRRGFGTVALQSWPTGDGAWEEFTELPVAHDAKTADEWVSNFKSGLAKIRGWYPTSPTADHLVLGPTTRFYLIKGGHEKGGKIDPNTKKSMIIESWEYAMNQAGRLMQDFRQRHGMGASGDYDRVRNHLCIEYPKAPGCGGSGTRLKVPPDRAAFGLPLAFRYGSLSYPLIGRDGKPVLKDGKPRDITPGLTFQGQEHDRNASPIHIRIIQIGEKCYPFFARFDAPLLANGEKVAIKPKSAPHIPIGIGSRKILDDFCKTILDPASIKPVMT